MEQQVKDAIDKILDELKVLAKDYGAFIIVALAVLYIWRKIK